MDQHSQRDITFSELYQWKKGQWHFVTYICHGCSKHYKTPKALETHPDNCKRVNRLYKEKKNANKED